MIFRTSGRRLEKEKGKKFQFILSCRCEHTAFSEQLQKNAGKDVTHILNASTQKHNLIQMMESYIVGNYCQPEPDISYNDLDSLQMCSTLLDTERYLGYLLGLHSHNLRQSIPLQSEEILSKEWLNADFLSGGLQVSTSLNILYINSS